MLRMLQLVTLPVLYDHDDDPTPYITIYNATTDESNTATNMTVRLGAISGRDVTVDYATSNGTATAGSDYTATSGTLTISAELKQVQFQLLFLTH